MRRERFRAYTYRGHKSTTVYSRGGSLSEFGTFPTLGREHALTALADSVQPREGPPCAATTFSHPNLDLSLDTRPKISNTSRHDPRRGTSAASDSTHFFIADAPSPAARGWQKKSLMELEVWMNIFVRCRSCTGSPNLYDTSTDRSPLEDG